jgi:hypothetical protein
MSSDNSNKGPDDDDDDDDVEEYDVAEVASSTNSDDEDDDAAEFLEFVDDPIDIESQLSSPPSMTTQFSSCHPPVMAHVEFTAC